MAENGLRTRDNTSSGCSMCYVTLIMFNIARR